MKEILVLCGGKSTEHAISLRSARNIVNELWKADYSVHICYIDESGKFAPCYKMNRPVDAPEDLRKEIPVSKLHSIAEFCNYAETLESAVVFPVIHGQSGEDGEIQGLLQSLGLPYVGNGLTASALCMDKGFANAVFVQAGLPHAKFYVLTKFEYENTSFEILQEKLVALLGQEFFVKPANNGSSIGVSRATPDTLKTALKEAFIYDNRVVVEEEIKGVELEISVLGNEKAVASLPGSYTTVRETLDYTAKYNDAKTIENVPHSLSKEKTEELQTLALHAYHVLGCEGFARVDIFMNPQGEFFINEINTFPGMTPTSLAPKLWTALTSMTFLEYLETILRHARESQQNRKQISTVWRNV